MMRSLYTAASGMSTQQLNVDTISNNMANVNTVGFKKERMEFQSLLYETMASAKVDQDGKGTPVNMQVGHGVRPTAMVKTFSQGVLEQTQSKFDFAIDGKGFFAIQNVDGSESYTRAGNFKISVYEDQLMLATNDGAPVLSTDGEPILFDKDTNFSKISIRRDGSIIRMNNEGNTEDLGVRLKVVQFSNPQGLIAKGSNLFNATSASGEPLLESEEDTLVMSTVMQGYLERSNVDIVDSMVKMIVAQRAYEINSQSIKTSDEMLQQANQLKR